MRRVLQFLAVCGTFAAATPAWAGPISGGQGMGPLGPRGHECQPGSEAAGRAGCKSFRSGDVSRRDDIRCADIPTRTGTVRVCRD